MTSSFCDITPNQEKCPRHGVDVRVFSDQEIRELFHVDYVFFCPKVGCDYFERKEGRKEHPRFSRSDEIMFRIMARQKIFLMKFSKAFDDFEVAVLPQVAGIAVRFATFEKKFTMMFPEGDQK